MTAITNQHRQAIEIIAIAMNLTDVTTPRMRKNGSIRLYDPIPGVYYSLHESGYIRRHIKESSWGRPKNEISTVCYQLNPTVKYGEDNRRTARILVDIDKQIVTLINAVVNYRGTIQNSPNGN